MEVMTLNPRCDHVETSEGVPVTVTGVAQVKVMTSPELLAIASEQFLGKSSKYISDLILQTLEGHLRAILGMACRMQNISLYGNKLYICITFIFFPTD